MSNPLSTELKAELFKQESGDPFLTLMEISHASFGSPIRLVNNTEDIVSNGVTYRAVPIKIRLPQDDGENVREFGIEIDNVSLELIEAMRTVTTEMDVRLFMILASMPNVIQMSHTDLKLRGLTYNKTKITAKIALDNFLAVAMTSERYTPTLYPGLF